MGLGALSDDSRDSEEDEKQQIQLNRLKIKRAKLQLNPEQHNSKSKSP